MGGIKFDGGGGAVAAGGAAVAVLAFCWPVEFFRYSVSVLLMLVMSSFLNVLNLLSMIFSVAILTSLLIRSFISCLPLILASSRALAVAVAASSVVKPWRLAKASFSAFFALCSAT